jgi:ribonuclease Z
MDCGEGTLGQLVRFFGQDHHHPDSKTCSFWEVLRQIDAVYISHLHADHHIGLIGLLRARRRAFSDERVNPSRAPFKPACILAPPGLKKWLDWYSVVYEKIDDTFEFFDNKALFKNVEVSDEAGGEEKTAKQVTENRNFRFPPVACFQAPSSTQKKKIWHPNAKKWTCKD